MKLVAWLKAARLPSQSYIALPLLLGQVMAWRATGSWSWEIFALVQAFGVFDQFYIVFANDYADRETDVHNETSTIFSGGSRVLVDGTLSPASLLRAALVMVVLSVATGATLAGVWGRVWTLPLMLVGLGLLWAYSYGPIRLSYRGGGELLQMLGVGLVLPLIGWDAQAGGIAGFPWETLAFLLPMNLATGICTALPDEPSDRASDKRSLAVLLGGATARKLIVGLNLAGMAAFGWLAHGVIPDLDVAWWTLLVVPAVGVVGQLLSAPSAQPGSRGILVFVFCGLLTNLALTAGIVLALAPL